MKYHLEVYEPGDAGTVVFSEKSQNPFGAISVGDWIGHTSMRLNDRLEVTRIEHLFWDAGGIRTHKICIHTKAVKL